MLRLTGLCRREKSRAPDPEKVKSDVSSSLFLGNRNTTLQVLPEAPWGMLKSNTEDLPLLFTSPKYEVPAAVLGVELSIGMIKVGKMS